MTLIGTTSELVDLGGGQQQLTQHIKPVGFYTAQGSLQYINNDFEDSGDGLRPHIVTTAPMFVSVGSDGARRIHPTRELDRYFEIGAPYVKIGGVWTQVSLGSPSRTRSRLQWTTAQANVYLDMAGHYCKVGILLKNGWRPEGGQFAFPVGIQGLTRQGGQLYADGVPVMSFRAPVVYDYDNEDDVRAIDWRFVPLGGQNYILFTLPDLAGMSKPLVDPTLALQPDAASGDGAYISGRNPTTNTATSVSFNIGEINTASSGPDRGLLRFSLSAIPSSAAVVSATLSLWLRAAGTSFASNNRTLRAYRLRSGRDWIDTQATWNVYKTSTNWATAGASDTTTDRESASIGSSDLATTDAVNTQHDFVLTSSAVEEWISGVLVNNGVILIADTELNDLYQFHSANGPTPSLWPKLTIVYTEGGLLLFRQRYGG